MHNEGVIFAMHFRSYRFLGRALVASLLVGALAAPAVASAQSYIPGQYVQCAIEYFGAEFVVLTYGAPNSAQGRADAGGFCTRGVQGGGWYGVSKYVAWERSYTLLCQAHIDFAVNESVDVYAAGDYWSRVVGYRECLHYENDQGLYVTYF